MPTLDIFNDDAFSMTSLTAKVNGGVYVPGQIGARGIFEEEGVDTTSILVESHDGELSLVAETPRGGPGETAGSNKRELRSFRVPHFQRDDSVMADEVQGVRAFGEETAVETVLGKVETKMAKHARALDLTAEKLRVGALTGRILNKAGGTIYNLFTEFDIAEPTAINFALDVDATKVRTKCYDLKMEMEDALEDEYSGIEAVVGREFWKSLIEHKTVKETYLNTLQAAELRGDPAVDMFEFGGIVWHRYRTGRKAKAANGAANLIGDDEARFFFTGVPELFITRFAPADYEETVNTIGLPRYAKQYAMPNGKGRHLEVQSNMISLCTRPGTLFKATRTA